MQLLHARHMPSFLGLLHTVADKHDASTHVQERSEAANGFLPRNPQRVQRPGRRTKEMEHRLVMARMQRQIPDDGSHTEMIGTNHQTDNDDNEPLECGYSGKTITECQ